MAESPQIMILNPEAKVSPAILAGLLSRNVSLIYQWAQIGRLPDIKNGDYTYKECLAHLLNSLLLAEEAKKAKIEEAAKEKREKRTYSTESEYDDTMHPLMAAKLKQSIKTEYAREAELWQKIAIKRGEFIAFADKLELVEGFVTSIRDTLLHIGNNFPEIQSRVDEAMEELYQLGVTLIAEADIDADNYIDTMLAKEPETKDIQDE